MSVNISGAWLFETLGDSEKPALLMLHGFMGAGSDWRDIAEYLGQDFYCILPDLPGHGDNLALPPSQEISLSFLAKGLSNFLDQISIQNAHILGYSLGGRVALRFALDFPAKVASLILESANPGIADESLRAERLGLDEKRAADLSSMGMDAFIESWYDMPLFSTLHQHPDRLQKLKAKRKANNIEWVNKYLVELSPGQQTPMWERLPGLEVPVLLMAGVADSKYVNVTTQMAASISNSTRGMVPDAGHNIHWEKPREFSDIVKHFLLSESQ